jgi:hypothetical protein
LLRCTAKGLVPGRKSFCEPRFQFIAEDHLMVLYGEVF